MHAVPNENPIVLVLPRFSPWMKRLSIASAVVWVVCVILRSVAPNVLGTLFEFAALRGATTLGRWRLWTVGTYAWLDNPGGFAIAWTVLSFWLIGSPVERLLGAKRTLELVGLGILGGALVALAASRVSPSSFQDSVVGMGAASSALLAGMGFVYANQTVTFFGLAPMKGKHLVLALAALSVLLGLYSRSAIGAASIGGLASGAGWMWLAARRGGGKGSARRGRKTSGAHLRVVPKRDAASDPKQWN